MSDTPAGPDWWLASDGKWYPPTSRPGVPLPPVVGPGPYDSPPAPDWWLASDGKWYPPTSRPGAVQGVGYSYGTRTPTTAWVSRALAGWVQGIFWATAAAAVALAITSARAMAVHDDYRADRASRAQLADANDAQFMAFGLMGLGVIALAVMVIVWTYKAHQATDRLAPGSRSWARGWSIGGWFIPLANFVIPKLVLNEIERIATAPRTDGVVDPAWRRHATSVVGWIWWLTWVAGSIFMTIADIGEGPDALARSASQLRDAYAWGAMSGVTLAISAVCAALFVRRVSRPLNPEALATHDPWGSPSGTPSP